MVPAAGQAAVNLQIASGKKNPCSLNKICLCVCSNGQQESARGGRGHVSVASKINLAAGLFWKNVCSATRLSELMGLRGFTHLSV